MLSENAESRYGNNVLLRERSLLGSRRAREAWFAASAGLADMVPGVMTQPHRVDVRRRAGWLPDDQDELESWLDGHRDRVEARGEQVVLHPVLTELQELIDADPVVRMYMSQMITQVPSTKPYRKRHLESVQQLIGLINGAPDVSVGVVSG